MPGITYDTGALIAGERGDRRMWALHAGLLALGVSPVVPALVLAEAWRGGPRQANLVRLLSLCAVEPMSDGQARRVGVLAGNTGHDDVVDVSVVEGALRRGDGVVTANRGDINLIARAAGAQLHVEDV